MKAKPAVILHLGDFVLSGESMFKAVADDVTAYVEVDRPWNPVDVRFVRIALSRQQVEEDGLPTASPKATDARSRWWSGKTCRFEALPPGKLAELLDEAFAGDVDQPSAP